MISDPKNILPKVMILLGSVVSAFFDMMFSAAHNSVAPRIMSSPVPKVKLFIFRSRAFPMSSMIAGISIFLLIFSLRNTVASSAT